MADDGAAVWVVIKKYGEDLASVSAEDLPKINDELKALVK